MESERDSSRDIYTIGHSNHPIERFLELLQRHAVEVLIDIRSSPFSRFSRQFNHDALKLSVQNAGLKYLYLGKELGGKPKEPEFYDQEGHVDYARIAGSERFSEGLDRLIAGAQVFRVAMMCSEEDPVDCHRRLLVGAVLGRRGLPIKHIRGNGELQLEEDLVREENEPGSQCQQLTLFSQPGPAEPWRSKRPVKKRD